MLYYINHHRYMSRKNSRSDSIEIFINRRRTSSSSSSSVDSRSISIDSITMEEKDNIGVNTNKNKKQIAINKETIRRTRDVYYELELQPSPNPLYLTHLTGTPWDDNESMTKK
jgi:hypothetical protein